MIVNFSTRHDAGDGRFAAVMEMVSDAVVLFGADGLIQVLNAKAERLFGRAAADWVGQPVARLLGHGDWSERLGRAGGRAEEAVLRRADGDEFPAELELGGTATARVLVIRDLSAAKAVEAELRESESRFRDLAGSASDWFWEADTDYRLTFVSERIASVLGVKPAAVIGLSFFDLGLGDARPDLVEAHSADIAAMRPFRDLSFGVGPEGAKDYRIVRISGIPLFGHDHEFIGYRGVGSDITREAMAERHAASARQTLVEALESLSDGIVVFDAEDRLVICNRTYRTMFLGLGISTAQGASFMDILDGGMGRGMYLHGGLAAEEWRLVRLRYHQQATGEPFVMQLADGRWIQSREYRTSDGGVLGVRTDISEAKAREAEMEALHHRTEEILSGQQRELERLVRERTAELEREVEVRTVTEQALRASRQRLKGIADSLFEGVLVIDKAGQLVFANGSARRLLAWPAAPGDIEGHHLDEVLRLKADGRPVAYSASPWRLVASDGVTLRDDDAIFDTPLCQGSLSVAYACSPVMEDGQFMATVISFRDIEILKQAQREALQSSRMASVGQLAAGIAHEINTPVQYIGDNLRFIASSVGKLAPVLSAAAQGADSFLGAAKAGKLDYLMAEIPNAVDESLDGVAQITRIVQSMKEFSHPGTSNKTVTDLNRAIESTLTVSRNTWKHVAELDLALAADLPPVLCYAGEMNQVFLNLIVNAAHAIEASVKPLPGRIQIATRRLGEMVEVTVADSGDGIPDAIRDRIFDPFFTTKDVGKGTGQGLAICRDVVVAKHGGRIEVDGRAGQGALFTVRIPIGDAAGAQDEEAS
jgi:PAS domain S-box-containing protein